MDKNEQLFYLRADESIGWNCHGGDIGGGYSKYHVVVAKNPTEATQKLLNYLNSKAGLWEETSEKPKLLTEGKDIPLEKRLKILKEVIEVIK